MPNFVPARMYKVNISFQTGFVVFGFAAVLPSTSPSTLTLIRMIIMKRMTRMMTMIRMIRMIRIN